jgi:hypothetical protein
MMDGTGKSLAIYMTRSGSGLARTAFFGKLIVDYFVLYIEFVLLQIK